MWRKRLLILVILAVVLAGGLFAKEGFVRAGFGAGIYHEGDSGYSETFPMIALDVDFVNRYGLTFGLTEGMVFPDYGYTAHTPMFGFGYTYAADRFCLGAKLVGSPMILDTGGLNISGTFWIIDCIGISAAADFLFFSDYLIILFRAGVSIRI